ncbi:hypothetical protein CL644_01895 [bacterium]|nr:hypothetical protein [bacterium]|tara:strand:- start:3487 stop:4152 length:666 start_codon:yes stop_codon:yes gene_type:complete
MKRQKKRNRAVNITFNLLEHHPVFVAGMHTLNTVFDLRFPLTLNLPITVNYVAKSNSTASAMLELLSKFNLPQGCVNEIYTEIFERSLSDKENRSAARFIPAVDMKNETMLDRGKFYLEVDADASKEEIIYAWRQAKKEIENEEYGEDISDFDELGEKVWELHLSGAGREKIRDVLRGKYEKRVNKNEHKKDTPMMPEDVDRLKSRYRARLSELAPLPKGY